MKKLIALVMSSLISSSIFVPSIIFANEKPSETPKKMEQIRECKRDKQCPCEDKRRKKKHKKKKTRENQLLLWKRKIEKNQLPL